MGRNGVAWALGLLGMTACQARASCPPGAGVSCEAACPASAHRAGATCACADGVVLEGSCVAPATAAAFCGKAATYQAGGCLPKTCPPSDALDDVTGACETPGELRDLGHADDGQTLGCEDGYVLLVDPSHARCVAATDACPRGATWTGGGCRAERACPPGSLAERGACIPFVRGTAPSRAVVVDVGEWTRLVIGPDGGEGRPDLCAGIARRPWLFSTLTGASPIRVRAEFTLTFPDNDVTRVHERVTLWDLEHRPLSEAANNALAQSARTLVEALRAAGGSSTAASVTATVSCRLLDTSDPQTEPLPGSPPGAQADTNVKTRSERAPNERPYAERGAVLP